MLGQKFEILHFPESRDQEISGDRDLKTSNEYFHSFYSFPPTYDEPMSSEMINKQARMLSNKRGEYSLTT